jgi:ADP-ribose pyrophosphatase
MEELFSGHGWRITLESASLPDGRVKKIARAEYADSASVLAFVDENRILVLREYRPFYKDYIWMLPSGRIDKENDASEGAHRELREETGFRAESFKHYCTVNIAEGLKKAHHFFIAKNLKHDPLPQDHAELIEVHELTLDDALDRILQSSTVHMASAFGVLRYLRENR